MGEVGFNGNERRKRWGIMYEQERSPRKNIKNIINGWQRSEWSEKKRKKQQIIGLKRLPSQKRKYRRKKPQTLQRWDKKIHGKKGESHTRRDIEICSHEGLTTVGKGKKHPTRHQDLRRTANRLESKE